MKTASTNFFESRIFKNPLTLILTPPATAGKPKERGYMRFSGGNDEEIGQPSDIVNAVFRSI